METYQILGICVGVLAVVSAFVNLMLVRKLRQSKRSCEWATGLISRLADEDNWGEITVMSSRSDGAQVYKTWIGDGDPQDLAKRATQ